MLGDKIVIAKALTAAEPMIAGKVPGFEFPIKKTSIMGMILAMGDDEGRTAANAANTNIDEQVGNSTNDNKGRCYQRWTHHFKSESHTQLRVLPYQGRRTGRRLSSFCQSHPSVDTKTVVFTVQVHL